MTLGNIDPLNLSKNPRNRHKKDNKYGSVNSQMDLVNQRKKWTQSISSNPFNREVDSNGRFLSVDINSEMI